MTLVFKILLVISGIIFFLTIKATITQLLMSIAFKKIKIGDVYQMRWAPEEYRVLITDINDETVKSRLIYSNRVKPHVIEYMMDKTIQPMISDNISKLDEFYLLYKYYARFNELGKDGCKTHI